MLDLGFIRDIRRIVAALPAKRQSALFSATMPQEVATLAETLLRNPLRVDVARSAPAALPIEQHVHFVEPAGKRALLGRPAGRSCLVPGHRVHPHEARRQPGRRRSGYRRRAGGRAARQQEPASAAEGAGTVPHGPGARAGGNRHRRARDRRDRHLPRHQLRSPGPAGGLCAPHWPHGACRRERCGNIVL